MEFWGPEGCGYSIGFLKALSNNAILSGIIFLVFGLVLCFGGIKFYKDMLIFFIPIMIAILGFYLYLNIVVKNVDRNTEFFLVIVTVFILAVIVSLVVMFTSAIYVILSCIVSYQLGLMLHRMLQPKVEFFKL